MMGRVFKRADSKNWQIEFWDGARRIRVATKTTKKKEAEAILALHEASVVKGEFDIERIKRSRRFSEFAGDYLEHTENTNEPGTHRRKKSLVNNLLEAKSDDGIPFFAEKKLKDINAWLVNVYRNKRLADGMSKASVNREVACLRHMYNVAIDWGIALSNPARSTNTLKKFDEDNEIANPITEHDEELLIQHAAPHLKPVIQCGIDTGMRHKEIRALRWENVDLDRRTIYVEKKTTKGKKGRPVPMTGRLVDVLTDLKARARGPYVFTAPVKGHRTRDPNAMVGSFDTAWRGAVRRAKLTKKGYRFHDMRATFATRLIEEGKSLIAIKEIGGWSTTRMLERYARLSEQAGHDTVAALDERRRRKSVVDLEERSS